MSTHKNIDRICIATIVICLLLTAVFMNGSALGIVQTAHAMGYEERLFNTDKVHTIDIVMDNWDEFITTAQSEEYSDCTVIIDGEAYKNVGIRGKGNTSLSTVASMDSDRYSFKIEFDQYDSSMSYYGLDKLSLNNVIQDNTYMKDYLTYRMMNEFGTSAPLCSFAYITVNGEEWGLYLAVEGVEDSFLQRNYGNDYGELYKPDSMSFGGGRGNGKDFDINEFENKFNSDENAQTSEINKNKDVQGGMPQRGEGFVGGKGMGSDDVKLHYTDDSYDSYSNIWNNAKTDITDNDKERLIASLKSLSEYDTLEEVVDIEKVIRYFVVHNFVCNGDSYTGSMIHNYYLYEENGQLSMIPWDYNLAFGTFHGGNASEQINSPIDTPVSGDMSERPMVGWIFSNETYTEMYHKKFSDFLASVNITEIIDNAYGLISEYVEKDPTKFCTYEEFEKGVKSLRTFCQLRTESVKGQLEGTIPSTTEGQNKDASALIDVSEITLSDMGTMNMGGGKGSNGDFGFGMNKGNFGGRGQQNQSSVSATDSTDTFVTQTASISLMANNGEMPQEGFEGMTPTDGFEGMAPPDGFEGMTPPDGFGAEMPGSGDFEMPTDENGNPVMPENFDGNMQNFENFDSQTGDRQSESSSEDTMQAEIGGDIPSKIIEGNGGTPDFGELNGMPVNSTNNYVNIILLVLSAVILAGGILFAWKFKR